MKKIFSMAMLMCLLFSCDAILEPDISGSPITLLSPTHQATLQAGTNAFHWESVEGALSYRFQIATPSFENATQIVADTLTLETSASFLLQVGNYEWRVSANNSASQTSFNMQSFVVE